MGTGYLITRRSSWNTKEYTINSSRVSGLRLQSAQITKDISSYPSLTLTLDPTQREFPNFKIFTNFIKVTRPDKGKVLFEGRVISMNDSMDSSGTIQKQVDCESLEGFLHDSVQPFKEFHNTTPKAFLQAMITEHNKQVEDYKQITLGTVTVTNSTDNVYRFTDETKDTYDNIQDKLVSRLGGEIRIRHERKGLYLDYLPEISETNAQTIELGKNLMSLTRSFDPSSVVTVLKPLGATQEPKDGSESDSEVSYPRLNISSVNDGSMYLKDKKLIEYFGIQTKTQTWDDVTTAQQLLTKAKDVMTNQNSIKMQVQVGYVDLSHVTPKDFDEFDCGQVITIKNALQGVDVTKRITGMSIDLLTVSNSTITIGDESMTGAGYEAMFRKDRERERADFDNKIKYNRKQIKQMQESINHLGGSDGTGWKPGGTFIDLSSNNESQPRSWYQELKDGGVKGAIIKLTEGVDYTNKLYIEQRKNITAVGMKFIGTYHMLTATTTDEAEKEAQYYVKQLKARGVSKSNVVCCDIEKKDLPNNKETLNAIIAKFYAVLSEDGFYNTVDYSSLSWFNERFDSSAVYKWIASWDTPNKPDGADAWQYTTKFAGYELDASKSYNKIFV